MKKKALLLMIPLALGAMITLAVCVLQKPAFPTLDPGSLTPDQVKTLASLEQISTHPLYRMTYSGDYSSFLTLKDKYYWALGIPKPKCSTFAALDPSGDSLLGYNSDDERRPLLLLYTDPPDGYASVSIADIGEGFGFDVHHTPFDSAEARTLLLYSPYFINTGMNEMGLAFAVMAVPETKSSFDPEKETVVPSEIRRYFLDRAKNVDEAIAILGQYNVSFSKSIGSHILLADRSGHSAVAEWVDGTLQVTHNRDPWQVATNVMIYGAQARMDAASDEFAVRGDIAQDINGRSYWRYLTAQNALRDAKGRLSPDEGMALLQAISLVVSKDVWWPTQYSVVYNLNTGELQLALGRDYQQIMHFQLRMQADIQ